MFNADALKGWWDAFTAINTVSMAVTESFSETDFTHYIRTTRRK